MELCITVSQEEDKALATVEIPLHAGAPTEKVEQPTVEEEKAAGEGNWDDAAGLQSPDHSEDEGMGDSSAVVAAAESGACEGPDMEVCRQVHLHCEDLNRYVRQNEGGSCVWQAPRDNQSDR